ncbi:MAG: methyltransferase domain-containing protein [Corynebacterium sp.]|uniref:class I SAM-dependent methyltransferase n=1 Tax=Corynebacterium sp. TaxID=1720 RepID=UPI0026DFF816|nr:class I SAM-dependent methyltransferase [Corynebacterium sp.]MDO5671062.1 methyltransferase domain-containing protein [Corynebacterium sp.]
MHGHGGHQHTDFDEFYAGGHRWSGNPNEALISQVGDLVPGRVLDIGCGEGADAVWLAERGWQVTAIDIAEVAVERAREMAGERGVDKHISFVVSTLDTWLSDYLGGSFDLICGFFFPATVHTEQARELARLLTPGGTLLWVDHDWEGQRPERLSPAEMEALITDLVAETTISRISRHVTHGAGAHHHEDIILRAVR